MRQKEILKKYDLDDADMKQDCMNELTDYISKLYSKPTREIYSTRASEILGLSVDGIKSVVEIKAAKYAKKEKSFTQALTFRQFSAFRRRDSE